ncbi:MAG: YigZ family protein [Lactobacillus sp.]|uniref:YigZ family protein n=1 Tax=Lactobacillus porci TaxID=2012477 RepID=A0A6A8MBU8_9LACO|nr:YigZ family protein [Lactobacillus porci]MDD6416535.1 YigZ family protein [Lactobacillus porci]MST86633.1 YigZ family protein [Lactobacillus porci]
MSNKADFLTIKENGDHELVIKKSRFIATMGRVTSEAEAKDFIAAVSKKYHDATHNTYAYTLGLNDEQVKASDNGEPSGTAGIPELKALQLMKLKNVAVVVTRYFGGIKLGAGGLIRAYSNSVTSAAEAIGVVKRVMQQEIIFAIPYNRYDEINHYLEEADIFVESREYAADITISVFLDLDQVAAFEAKLTDLMAGKIDFLEGDQRYNEIPLKDFNYHEQG